MNDYAQELAGARELAIQAGDVLVRHFQTDLSVEMKGWADPVTAADRESERLIRSGLQERFPSDGIDGEEEPPVRGSSGRVWLIDPLDGTADFAGGLPIFAVVLTLIEAEAPERPLVNVTYDPIRRELFHAVRGGGAFLNDRPMRMRPRKDLASALIHVDFFWRRQEAWQTSLELVRRITAVAPHVRTLGSAALAQAYVAAGRLDGYAKVVSGRYDIVGGNLLITEAGGIVTDLAGRPWRARGSLLAAPPDLHSQLLSLTRDLELS